MKIMLHSCCGPCTTYSLEHLRQQGHEVKGIFFNPNIHPYTEFRRRLEAFAGFCAQAGHEAQIVDEYGLRQFLAAVAGDIDARCAVCYEMRLRRAAQHAAQEGCDAFTTTLTISPCPEPRSHQGRGWEGGGRLRHRVHNFDFRQGYRDSIEMSRRMNRTGNRIAAASSARRSVTSGLGRGGKYSHFQGWEA